MSTVAVSEAPTLQSNEPAQRVTPRLVSLDAYRGFVMLLMVSEVMQVPAVANHFPGSAAWGIIGQQFDHTKWAGCSLWDLIQPSFMFIVGVSLPFSLASRRAKGQTFGWLLFHAMVRSLVLVGLGIFLYSTTQARTNFIFTNVLAQIGLAYPFLFLIAWTRPRMQAIAAAAILVAYWGAFVLYPWPHGPSAGFAAHWAKNANLAWAFDRWFLNLFPRSAPWLASPGGYATLNFVPSLATMIFGLLAGELLRGGLRPIQKLGVLLAAGGIGLGLGWALGHFGICPAVKRIWTPSWAIYSTGWTLLLLLLFHAAIDLAGLKRWAFPLVVVGMNPLAIYCMANLLEGFLRENLDRHLGPHTFNVFGDYAPLVKGGLILVMLWMVCWWMYRRRAFLRI